MKKSSDSSSAADLTKAGGESADKGASSHFQLTSTSSTTMDGSGHQQPFYRPNISQRSIVIQRSSGGGNASAWSPGVAGAVGAAGHWMFSRQQSYQSYASTAGTALTASGGFNAVLSSSENEKKDLQDLNVRFADYLQKVRFLEAQNRKMALELDQLKSTWGRETSQVKVMFQAELEEARKLYDEAAREKAKLEIRIASLEEQLEDIAGKWDESKRSVSEWKEKFERQVQQVSDYEAEVILLRRRVDQLETERDKDKKAIAQLNDTLARTRADLDNETLLHIDAENRYQTYEEELQFLKSVHEQEMKELAALAYRDTTTENREYWKSEMGSALREIQAIYDQNLSTLRTEMESSYNMKIQEVRTGATRQNIDTTHFKEETKRVRTQLQDTTSKLVDYETKYAALTRELEALRRDRDDVERDLQNENAQLRGELVTLRATMDATMKELQAFADKRLSMEMEIATYRKLLEGEETRSEEILREIARYMESGGQSLSATYSQYLESGGGSASASMSGGASASASASSSAAGHGRGSGAVTISGGAESARRTFSRSAKGPMAITECDKDGKYIVLENTGRKDEIIGNWTIKRIVDGEEKPDVSLPEMTVKPATRVTIWVKGAKPENATENDFECDEQTLGVGANITTKLVNPAGEDRATFVQKTTYVAGSS